MAMFQGVLSATDAFFSELTPVYNQIVTAIIILIMGFVAGRIIGLILDKLFTEFLFDKAINKITQKRYSFGKIISDIISFAIYVMSIYFALNILGGLEIVEQIFLWLTIVVFAGTLILSLLDLIPNIISGFIIRNIPRFAKGNNIRMRIIKGEVKSVGIVNTKIINDLGDSHYFPNKGLFSEINNKNS